MFESSFWILPRQGENSKGDFLEIQSRHDIVSHSAMYMESIQFYIMRALYR